MSTVYVSGVTGPGPASSSANRPFSAVEGLNQNPQWGRHFGRSPFRKPVSVVPLGKFVVPKKVNELSDALVMAIWTMIGVLVVEIAWAGTLLGRRSLGKSTMPTTQTNRKPIQPIARRLVEQWGQASNVSA
jgi:hypothetical protein